MNERALAIQHVTSLIGAWESARAYGDAARGIRRHVIDLKREIGLMQSAGEPGETLAHRWCRVSGLGTYP